MNYQFLSLPSLAASNKQYIICKICGNAAGLFDVVDFNKHAGNFYCFGISNITVSYFRCDNCDFVFTSFFDGWSAGDFSNFIYNDDYIKVDPEYNGPRPKRIASRLEKMLSVGKHLRILDYGSGSGLLEQYLREVQFTEVASFDPFSTPTRPPGKFDIITCFEVIEHTTDPLATLKDIASFLSEGGCVIFETGIQPQNIETLRANWWYVAPRNGHASIYTLKALSIAAKAVGLTLYTGPGGMAFSKSLPSATSLEILTTVGYPFRFFRLFAPKSDEVIPEEQLSCWNDLESVGPKSYRWTKNSNISWRLQSDLLLPCHLEISVPLQNEVQRGFGEKCQLLVGGKSVPLVRFNGNLRATVQIETPSEPIVNLATPPLLRPSALRAVDDNRSLGLAITAGPP